MDRDTQIQRAAEDLAETISARCGALADDILDRPQIGTPEWLAEHAQRETPAGHARLAEWHLVKMQISRLAGASQTGDVLGARRHGASWQAIADACGITRQAAHDRWAKHTPRRARSTPADRTHEEGAES